MFHHIVGRVVTKLDAFELDLKALGRVLDVVRRTGKTEEARSKRLHIRGDADERCPLWIHVNKYRLDGGVELAQVVDRFGDAVQRGWTGALTGRVTKIYCEHRVGRKTFDRVGAPGRSNQMEIFELGPPRGGLVGGGRQDGGPDTGEKNRAEQDQGRTVQWLARRVLFSGEILGRPSPTLRAEALST